jgi:peroxiredoxin
MSVAASLLSLVLGLVAPQDAPSPAPIAPSKQDVPSVEDEMSRFGGAEMPAALDALLAHHLDSDELELVSQRLARAPTFAGEEFLRTVAAKSASRKARGRARFDLAQHLLAFESTAQRLADPKTSPAARELLVARLGKPFVEALAARDVGAMRKDAERLLQEVVDDYYLLDDPRKGYLGAVAEPQLFELQRLQIGMVAPEIEGTDLEGVTFKLSDYRGKVVVLDFWGYWCPICRRNLPAERAMVAKYKDDAFALLGVNSDPKERIESSSQLDRIPWRNIFDGGDPYGPIARRWNVDSWPVIYVLDEDGVIRFRTESAEQAGAKAAELLEAPRSKPVAPPAPPKPKWVKAAPAATPAAPAAEVRGG